jgi:hypothetical protein
MMDISKDAWERDDLLEAIKAFRLENDGSSWDTCCGQALRDLIENPLIDAVYDRIKHFATPHSGFFEARKAADKKKTLKLRVNTNKVNVTKFEPGSKWDTPGGDLDAAYTLLLKRVHIHIDSIRRSGDRGTSILNWIINLVCWAWVLCGSTGCSFTHSNGKVCVDIFGMKRRFKVWLEGDDSLLWLTGRHFLVVEIEVLEARWSKLGHRPKLFMRTKGDEAEFCGWKICVTDYGLDADSAVPDVPRMLCHCYYTTARAAVTAALEGDSLQFGRQVAPALLARASSIATRVPSIANYLVRCADELLYEETVKDKRWGATDNLVFNRDDMFRMGQDAYAELLPEWWKDDDPTKLIEYSARYETFVDQVRRLVSSTVASGGLARECALARQHKWVRNDAEWYTFITTLDHVSLQTSDADFRAMLPIGLGGECDPWL